MGLKQAQLAPAVEKIKENTGGVLPKLSIPQNATVKERMQRKLRTLKGRSTYSQRKQIVEPVFGQIKEVRGFRRFSYRDFEKVQAEWELICLTHNLLKLFRSGIAPPTA